MQSVRMIWKVSRWSQKCRNELESFQMNRTHFIDYPDTFIWIFCVASGHFPNYLEILQPIMSMLQKLSGFTKTFRSALLTRWQGFSDSGHQWKKTIRRNLLFCFGKFPPRLLVACTHSLYKAAPPLKLIMFINVPNSLFIPPSSITKHQFELFGHWLQPWLINLSFGNVL